MLNKFVTLINQFNPWITLVFAIFCSAIATTCLKFLGKQGQGILLFLGIFCGYGLFLFLITIVLKQIDISIGYAVWAGLSTALMCISGVVFFKESMSAKKFLSISFIVIGVIGLRLIDVF